MPSNCTNTPRGTEVKTLSVGVDWVTATARPGHRAEELQRWGLGLADQLAQEGYEPRRWQWNRYAGLVAGQLAVGAREDGCIVRLSGAAAHAHYAPAIRLAGRVSRLDLQVTVTGVARGLDLAGVSLSGVSERPTRRGRPSEWTYLRTRSHGATLYLGSRASARYCRLYDKGAEDRQQHLSGDWRYEVEVKGDAAGLVGRQLVAQLAPAGAISATVWNEFSSHGVSPIYETSDVPLNSRIDPAVTDDERRLAWLRNDVSLTVARLLARGRRADVLAALGLDTTTEVAVR